MTAELVIRQSQADWPAQSRYLSKLQRLEEAEARSEPETSCGLPELTLGLDCR